MTIKSNHRYQIILTWSEVHQQVVAEMPEFPDCRATGATSAEALVAIQEEAQRQIETEERAGKKLPRREKRPLAEERDRLLAHVRAEGRREATACEGPSELLDETGLQVYAAEQMEALLTTEPIETDNTSALNLALREAYVASYRGAARERGWEVPG